MEVEKKHKLIMMPVMNLKIQLWVIFVDYWNLA